MAYDSENGRRPIEYASKINHSAIINSPDIKGFLNSYETVNFDMGKHIMPKGNDISFGSTKEISHIFAIDGSYNETFINKRFPSIALAYFNIGVLSFEMLDSEKFINPRYKIDLFIPDEKIGIEIKTVFLNKNYIYPYHSTLRKVNQLKQIICLQKENYNIKYVFVINIKNKKIELDLKDKAFCKLFIEAQRNGLTIEEIWLSCNEVGEILLEKV